MPQGKHKAKLKVTFSWEGHRVFTLVEPLLPMIFFPRDTWEGHFGIYVMVLPSSACEYVPSHGKGAARQGCSSGDLKQRDYPRILWEGQGAHRRVIQ